MNTAKVFQTGRSQAVRMPKEFRFSSSEVAVSKVDGMVVLFPRHKGWDLLAKSLDRFTDDYAEHLRRPSKADKRKSL